MAQLSAKIDALDPAELERTHAQALRGLQTAEEERRKAWGQILLLVDQRMKADDFESRLASAKQALGRTPSREDKRVKRDAAEIRAAMQGSSPDPGFDSRVAAARAAISPGPDRNVAARAQAVRESMKRARRSY